MNVVGVFLLWVALTLLAGGAGSAVAQDVPAVRVESVCCDFEPVEDNRPDIYSIDRFLFEFGSHISVTSLYVSRPRIWRDIATSNNVCTIRARKTPEREAVSYFTQLPHSLYPPLRLIVPSDSAGKFGDAPQDLGRLVSRGDVIIGLVQGQDYGPTIGAWIEAHPGGFFFVPSHDKAQETLIRTALAGRIDAFVGDSRTIDDFLGHMTEDGLAAGAFVRLPIKGVDVNLGYIACARSDEGKAVIGQLDKTLADPAALGELYRVHLEWFPPSERAFLRQLFHNIYGFRSPDQP